MSGTVDSELVAKFMEITGADSASAHFFLDMSKGNLDQAVTSFLDTDGAVGERIWTVVNGRRCCQKIFIRNECKVVDFVVIRGA